MRYIKSFISLFESTSAGSHDRGSSIISPFKYAINFDHRVGYTNKDFIKDLNEIYQKLNIKNRTEFMDFIFKNSGIFVISQISDLPQYRIDNLMGEIEKFLDSKAKYQPQKLPDGYFLCYEELFNSGKRFDVYYSPSLERIKITFTDSYPEVEEMIYHLEEFDPERFGLNPKDFNNTILKLKN